MSKQNLFREFILFQQISLYRHIRIFDICPFTYPSIYRYFPKLRYLERIIIHFFQQKSLDIDIQGYFLLLLIYLPVLSTNNKSCWNIFQYGWYYNKEFLLLFRILYLVERSKIRHYKQMTNNTIFILYPFKKFWLLF